MRVYVPSTFTGLADAVHSGRVGAGVGYAVTPALREWYASGDSEELEYAATAAAARASLRLVAADPRCDRRRVVLAAEVVDDMVARPAEESRSGPAAVELVGEVPYSRVVSAHVDDEDAVGDVAAAVAALPAADDGDEDARFAVDGAEGHELLWYASQEIPDLVGGG